MRDITIDNVSTDDGATFAPVGAMLDAFNTDAGVTFDGKPLRLIARTADGTPQGGVRGYTAWSWCFIDTLAVAQPYRRHGLGSRLLKNAEQVARDRGCLGLYLWTTSFQAPEFYKRHGYAAFGHLPDMPPGHAATWFMKRF